MQQGRTNVNKFITEQLRGNPALGSDFGLLVSDIVRSCKAIAQAAAKGALAGVLGSAGVENVQGETQKKLDVLANEAFIRHCESGWHGVGRIGRSV